MTDPEVGRTHEAVNFKCEKYPKPFQTPKGPRQVHLASAGCKET